MSTESEARVQRIATLPFEKAGAASGGLISGVVPAVRDIWGHRALLDLLIRRELKARYKDSALGFVWSFIRPLTMLAIYYFAVGQVLGAARSVPQFAIYVFAGLTLWGLYNEIIAGGTTSILANAGLIKKVYVPRELFPLASLGSALFNFVVQFAVLLAAVLVLGQFPVSWDLLYIPVAVVLTVIYGLAFALFLSAVNVYLRDVQYLVEVALLILFWASPIVYSFGMVVDRAAARGQEWIVTLYQLNPMTDIILAFQKGIWRAGSETSVLDDGTVIPPQPFPADLDFRLLVIGVVGLVLLLLAQRVFARLQGNFAQEI
ncbi:ABC transporter permease [Frigoribacterium sp. PvP032]|uniref:ABC transporter permease n=1 Tax=Frigoribacterium sp. PvP032 TaxID=2806589 RepID=UPI001AE56DC7|nr:ABC transporter permease [Frigoribacterium sp. PvP032]MBP1190270.1 ABC-2 type transport system permease protein [Frigoribacterium sp. PvP032]